MQRKKGKKKADDVRSSANSYVVSKAYFLDTKRIPHLTFKIKKKLDFV